jgi:hypothetical protein
VVSGRFLGVVSKSRLNAVRLGFCRPAVGFGIEIVIIEKAKDVCDQGCDAAKAARADDLGGDFAKEAFHQMEPGGRGRNEMDVKTGMALEPGSDLGVLVGGIVVANDVKLELGSHCITFGKKKPRLRQRRATFKRAYSFEPRKIAEPIALNSYRQTELI